MKKKIKNWFIYWSLRPFILIFTILPLSVSRFILTSLGGLAYYCDLKGRQRAFSQLTFAFKDSSPSEIKTIAKGVYAHLGLCVAELLKFPLLTRSDLDAMVTLHGAEHMERAFKKGKGVLAVTGHFGNWEILAAYVAQRWPVKVIARDVYDKRLNNLLNHFREKQGYQSVSRQGSVKPILQHLRNGGVFGILCDQDTGVDSVFVDFFGRPASTPAGPVRLARRTGAAILPAVIFREMNGKYKIVMGAEMPLVDTGNAEQDLKQNVQIYTDFLEKYIREHPEQWVWIHKRWRDDVE